jgi:hypothetical protein
MKETNKSNIESIYRINLNDNLTNLELLSYRFNIDLDILKNLKKEKVIQIWIDNNNNIIANLSKEIDRNDENGHDLIYIYEDLVLNIINDINPIKNISDDIDESSIFLKINLLSLSDEKILNILEKYNIEPDLILAIKYLECKTVWVNKITKAFNIAHFKDLGFNFNSFKFYLNQIDFEIVEDILTKESNICLDIDQILDKIIELGVGSLTLEEKEFLKTV